VLCDYILLFLLLSVNTDSDFETLCVLAENRSL